MSKPVAGSISHYTADCTANWCRATNTSCVWRAILPTTSAIHDTTELYLPWLSKHATISGYATKHLQKTNLKHLSGQNL
ncbi:hypothetical protein DPMN_165869 [Dreissena polymorpha]|uniref:Uncharacterized protein n=1 Tax=Dreissena polymorpha TaxID=45954 RepID=A0A9D4EXN3_DREPO|nr:hypothetical protein DPMN_165869 [Dreissena polymorpha]